VDCRTVETIESQLHFKNGVLEKCVAGENRETIFRDFKGAWAVGTSKPSVVRAVSFLKTSSGASEILGPGRMADRDFTIRPLKIQESLEEKLSFVKWVADILEAEGVKSEIIFADGVTTESFTNTTGESPVLTQTIPQTKLIFNAIATEGDRMETALEVVAGLGGWEVVETLTEETIRETARLAKNLLNAPAPKGGLQPVVIDPHFAGVLAHEAFGHAAEADHVVAGASVLTGKIGQQVASPGVSILDDPTIKGGFGNYGFDRDGVVARKNTVVNEGVLKTLLHNRHSAGQMKSESTGNCRGRVGQIRMSNTFFAPGDLKLEELLEDLKNGYLLIGSRGGTTSPATGFFNFTAKYGMEVVNGEARGLVRGVALLGSTLETLLKVSAISRDFQLFPGTCGKGSEWARVSVGGPYLKTEAVVGGSPSG